MSLTIPDTVERLGRNCFRASVFGVIVVSQESRLTRIGPGCFRVCCLKMPLLLPAGVEEIGLCCFEKSAIPSIEFAPNSQLRTIAFAECAIAVVHIPVHVSAIGESAFRWCKELRTVRFATNCELIQLGSNCFLGCPLEKIEIPRSVESIDPLALSGVSSVDFASGNQSYVQDHCFVFCPSETTILRFLRSTENRLSIPAYVEVLGPAGFSGSEVESVPFDGSVLKRIENQAFEHSSLGSIAIPGEMEFLGEGCFSLCTRLKCIDISKCMQLTQLGPFCFSNSGLRSVHIPAFVQVIDTYCFSYCCDLCTLSFAANS
jgi:hypothetical protein